MDTTRPERSHPPIPPPRSWSLLWSSNPELHSVTAKSTMIGTFLVPVIVLEGKWRWESRAQRLLGVRVFSRWGTEADFCTARVWVLPPGLSSVF